MSRRLRSCLVLLALLLLSEDAVLDRDEADFNAAAELWIGEIVGGPKAEAKRIPSPVAAASSVLAAPVAPRFR